MPERALDIRQLAASFKIGASHPLKTFQKMLGLTVLQLGPLERPSVVRAGCDSGNGLQKEGCFDRCVQHRLGSSVRGQTNSRPLVKRGKSVPYLSVTTSYVVTT